MDDTIILTLRPRKAPPFKAVYKVLLRVNPELVPAFMLGSRGVDFLG